MLPTFPMLRFVDRPTVDARVRFDLQDAPAMVLHDGVSLGVPSLEGEPDSVGRSWGFRQIRLTQLIEGSHADVVPLITTLTRELMRPTNWLQFQLSEYAEPVWFRTYLTPPGEVSYEYVYSEELGKSVWLVSVAIDAEPFAYGALVTLPSVTIGNNPASGSNPTRYVLPPIVGDAPAPLRLRISPVREAAVALISLLASDQQPTSYLIPSTVSQGADTSSPADATGIAGNRQTVTFATTATMATRAVWSGPVVPHGTYKVLARMSTSAAPSSFKIRIYNQYTPPKPLAGGTFPSLTTSWQWWDLGVIDWPVGALIDGDDWTAASSNFSAVFAAERTSGAGSLNLDAVLLVPIDFADGTAETMLVTWPASEANPQGAYVDAESRSVRLVSSGDQAWQASVPAQVVGEFAHVVPGVQNVLRLLATYYTTVAGGDSLATTSTVVLSYYPRWLYLAAS